MWKEIQKAQKQINEGSSFFGQKTDEVIGGQTAANVPPSDEINNGSSVSGQKKNEAITGHAPDMPPDDVVIPPDGSGGTSPNVQAGPSKISSWMKDWITFSEFVENVFDNEDIFASHELKYLKKNSSGLAGQKKAEEKMEEIAKKMNKEIYEKVSEDHNDDWETENPFEDRHDWRRITSDGTGGTKPLMFTDSSDVIPMMERGRTRGMMEEASGIEDRKLNRQIAKMSDGDE